VARLLALAIHFERLLQEGAVRDHAELARLGQISRTRLSQIMNLRYLALDIQEAILLLPPTQKGGPQLTEHHLRPLVAEDDWAKQRRLWDALQTRLTGAAEEG
jgi:hypothetical protein